MLGLIAATKRPTETIAVEPSTKASSSPVTLAGQTTSKGQPGRRSASATPAIRAATLTTIWAPSSANGVTGVADSRRRIPAPGW